MFCLTRNRWVRLCKMTRGLPQSAKLTAPSEREPKAPDLKKIQSASLVREVAATAAGGSKLRRPGAAKPHVFRAVSTENTKPSGFGGRRPASGCIFPEAARLSAAYHLQASRHEKGCSAVEQPFVIELVNPRPPYAAGIYHTARRISQRSALYHTPQGVYHLICFAPVDKVLCRLAAAYAGVGNHFLLQRHTA